MHRVHTTTALAVFAAAGAAHAQSVSYFGTHAGHDYYITQTGVTFTDARTAASDLASALGKTLNVDCYLATLNSAEEDQYLMDRGAVSFWIGLSDEAQEGDFVWDNGDNLTYSNWLDGEPNNQGNEDYVAMNRSGAGGWNDFVGHELLTALIEVHRTPQCSDVAFPNSETIELNEFTSPLVGSFAVADFDNDGHLDLAIDESQSDGDIDIRWGPNYTWQSVAAGVFVTTMATGDLNNDGITDIVPTINSTGGSSVRVVMGGAGRTFQGPQTISTVAPNGRAAIGDVNGDDIPDVVYPGAGSLIGVLLGNGDGTFQPQFDLAVGNAPVAVALLDANGDDEADIVVANITSDDVSLIISNADGTFQPEQRYSVGDGPREIAVGDLNNDAVMDVVVANVIEKTLSIFIGAGDGTLGAETVVPLAGTPASVVIADLTGDGNADVAATQFNPNGPVVFLGNGDGTLSAPRSFPLESGGTVIATGDFNYDGVQDLATSSDRGSTNDRIYVLFNSCPPCSLADWTSDDIIQTNDFVAYLNDFSAVLGGGSWTVRDPDVAIPFGVTNTADFVGYLNAYNAGCD